jgi:hypothetical protein
VSGIESKSNASTLTNRYEYRQHPKIRYAAGIRTCLSENIEHYCKQEPNNKNYDRHNNKS